jgi:hypothetical protein
MCLPKASSDNHPARGGPNPSPKGAGSTNSISTDIGRDEGLGRIGKEISVKPASRDASGCIIEHTKSARPPNHIDSHPVARAIPFT